MSGKTLKAASILIVFVGPALGGCQENGLAAEFSPA